MAEYRWADPQDPNDLVQFAVPIIIRHHQHLIGYPLLFLWRDEAKVNRRTNTVTYATAELLSGRTAWMAMDEVHHSMLGQEKGPRCWVIEVAADAWTTLSEAQRQALIDHELCHLALFATEDGDLVMGIREHDVEEFVCIMERHGPWEDNRKRLVDAANRHQAKT